MEMDEDLSYLGRIIIHILLVLGVLGFEYQGFVVFWSAYAMLRDPSWIGRFLSSPSDRTSWVVFRSHSWPIFVSYWNHGTIAGMKPAENM